MGQIISLTPAAASTPLQDFPSPPPLLLLLDVSFPYLKSLFLCRLARVHQEDRSSYHKSASPLKNVLANAPLTFTHRSTHSQASASKYTFDFPLTSHLTSQERARIRKCTVDYHLQVTSLLTPESPPLLKTLCIPFLPSCWVPQFSVTSKQHLIYILWYISL